MTFFDFTAGSFFLSLVFSGIGFVLFVYGRKQQRFPHLIAGIVLLAYPFVVSSAVPMTLVGIGILAALWLAVRQGY